MSDLRLFAGPDKRKAVRERSIRSGLFERLREWRIFPGSRHGLAELLQRFRSMRAAHRVIPMTRDKPDG